MANHNITITATDKTQKALKGVDKGLDKASRRALMLKGAIGLAGAAMAAFGALKVFDKVIDDMDSLAKRARNVGIESEEGFAKFQVASRLLERGGLEISEIDRMFRNLEGRMAKGLEGNKQYAEVMDKLGDSIFDANGELKEAPDLFLAVATAMQEGKIDIKDAQTILGEMVGPKVLGLFTDLANKGTAAGDAMAETADGMNLITFDQAGKAEAFNDAMDDLKDAFNDFLTEAITPLLPAMTTFIQDIVEKAPGLLEKFNEKMAEFQPVFDALGLVMDTVINPVFESFIEFLKTGSEQLVKFSETHPELTNLAIALTAVGVAIKLLNPYTAIIAAIALAFNFWPEIKEYVEEVRDNLGDFGIGAAKDKVVAMKDKIVEVYVNLKEATIEKITNMKNAIVDEFVAMKDKVMEPINKLKDGVVGVFEKIGNILVFNSVVPEMKEAIIAEFEELGDKTVLTTDKMVTDILTDYEKLSKVMGETTKEGAESVKTNMQEAADAAGDFVDGVNKDFNDRLVDGLVDGNLSFDTFADLWKSTLKDLLKDTLNGGTLMKDIFSSFGGFGSGGSGGGLGGIFSGISDFFGGLFGGGAPAMPAMPLGLGSIGSGLFGGFFADGGRIPAGQFGVVGEAGPELISGPARVTSNEDSFGGSTPPVNITIQAIDTQTGTEFLLKNKKQIEGIIQNAYNRRGKQGIY